MRRTEPPRHRFSRHQQGITLLIGLIMLIMLTLMGVAAFKFSNLNSMMAANSQHRMEATRAAEQSLEEVISSANIALVEPPLAEGWTKNGTMYSKNVVVSVNGGADGKGGASYNIELTRTPCISASAIKNSRLRMELESDLVCAMGQQQNFGIAGATTSDSLCAEVLREVRAQATDQLQQTRVEVTLGFGTRVATDTIAQTCN